MYSTCKIFTVKCTPVMAKKRASLLLDPRTHKKQCFATFLVHPRKLTCLLKRDYFNIKYIFQPLIFRGHVSFPGSIFFLTLFPFLLSTFLLYSSLLCFSSLHIVGSLTSKPALFRILRIHLPKDLPNKSSTIHVGIINPKNHLGPSKEVWMRRTARVFFGSPNQSRAWWDLPLRWGGWLV